MCERERERQTDRERERQRETERERERQYVPYHTLKVVEIFAFYKIFTILKQIGLCYHYQLVVWLGTHFAKLFH